MKFHIHIKSHCLCLAAFLWTDNEAIFWFHRSRSQDCRQTEKHRSHETSVFLRLLFSKLFNTWTLVLRDVSVPLIWWHRALFFYRPVKLEKRRADYYRQHQSNVSACILDQAENILCNSCLSVCIFYRQMDGQSQSRWILWSRFVLQPHICSFYPWAYCISVKIECERLTVAAGVVYTFCYHYTSLNKCANSFCTTQRGLQSASLISRSEVLQHCITVFNRTCGFMQFDLCKSWGVVCVLFQRREM